jgi:hypothetical protein
MYADRLHIKLQMYADRLHIKSPHVVIICFPLGPRANSEVIPKIHVGLPASRATPHPTPTLSSTFSLSGQIFVMALPSRNQTQPRRSTCFLSYTLQQCTSPHATTSSSRCFNLFPNGLCQKDERGTDLPVPEQ